MSTHGITLPRIGLGTYSLQGAAGVEQMTAAIEGGYRLIDTAYNYENEGAVGRAIAQADVPRDQLLVTSKLPGRYQRHDEALVSLQESLYRLGLDRLDLYLIHWPNPKQGRYLEAWKALLEAREQGLVTNIGVSNFLPEHIQELERETGVRPAVNQLELHPAFPQTELLKWHRERNIAVAAWSPLGRGELLEHPTLIHIAAREGLSPGELILAWHAACGTIPLPRSTSPERQAENLAAVDKQISAEAVAAITELGRDGRRLWNQDPAEYEEF